MEFLRSLRLRHVHEDLLRAEAGATVSHIAARWGFYQFGRFAGLYRQLCGESPSDTLRRARAMRD
jgi:transcriptional regulator GlxA family with amidase domain